MTLKEMLKDHEGLKLKPYKDTVGKLTIGYGRNLDDVGITKEEAEYLFDNDVKRAMADCRGRIDFFDEMPVEVQDVLINMCFNLGIVGLLKFKRFLGYLKNKDYVTASYEMLNSIWAVQVQSRALELSSIIRKVVIH